VLTHKLEELFFHPVAPSDAYLAEIRKDFEIFISGVMTGVLNRDVKDKKYVFQGKKTAKKLGSEGIIRRDGIADKLEESILLETASVLDGGGASSNLAMAALSQFYCHYVYPEKEFTRENGTTDHALSFWAFVISEMESAYKSRVNPQTLGEMTVDSAVDKLLSPGHIDMWTEEIPGSEEDVPKDEVGVDSSSFVDLRFRLNVKRRLRSDGSWKQAIDTILSPSRTASQTAPLSAATAPPPPPSVRMVHLSSGGKVLGQFREDEVYSQVLGMGLVPGATHVYWSGLAQWEPLTQHPELMTVGGGDVPPPPPP
jgi:hypothetical protein